MKKALKALKLTTSALALTGLVATPIILTGCSKTNNPDKPIDPSTPIETNGQIDIAWKAGAGSFLTNIEPLQEFSLDLDQIFTFKNNVTGDVYQANELDFVIGYFDTSKASLKSGMASNDILAITNGQLSIESLMVMPGELNMFLSSVSLKADSSITSNIIDDSCKITLHVNEISNEVSGTAWQAAISLFDNSEGICNANNLINKSNDLVLNLTEGNLSKYNGNIDLNNYYWIDYTDCSLLVPALQSKTDSNNYIWNSETNTSNQNVVETSNLNQTTFFLDKGLSNVNPDLINSTQALMDGRFSGIDYTNSNFQLLLTTDGYNYPYSLYRGKKAVFWIYINEAKVNLNNQNGEILQKITVNFN